MYNLLVWVWLSQPVWVWLYGVVIIDTETVLRYEPRHRHLLTFNLHNMSKILGIDYGDRRVGLAIAEIGSKTAVPYKIIENGSEENLLSQLLEIVKKENVEKIVLGLPLSLSGNGVRQEDYDNSHMQKFLAFKELLEEKLELPVIFEDERLSTRMAENLGGRKKGEKYDDVAAMLILQGYLDRNAETE